MISTATTPDHAALMDKVYRGQRHIYDLTRKYYLFGRDRLIRELAPPPGGSVLELGCGTGRNLELIARAWPGVHCHGLDISSEMLKNASARLRDKAVLAQGDATRFDAEALFTAASFDRVVCSYTLSMIPDWQAALKRGVEVLAPGASLVAVDFGDLSGLPSPLRKALRNWLARFHVEPRLELGNVAARLAGEHGLSVSVVRGPLGYYQLVRLTR